MARKYWSWIDGNYTQSPIAPANSSALLHGYGVFETIYCHQKNPDHLHAHLQRLRAGADHYNLQLTTSDQQLHTIIHQLLQKNSLSEARCRITLAAATTSTPPLPSHLLITVEPYKRKEKSIHLITAPSTQFGCPLHSHKSTSYASYRLAKHHAQNLGADDTLMTDHHGNIIECSSSNIFFAKGDQWFTPCLNSSGLPGIQRDITLNAFQKTQHPCEIRPVKNLQADFAFITNSLIGLLPVSKIDQTTLTPSPQQLKTLNQLKNSITTPIT